MNLRHLALISSALLICTFNLAYAANDSDSVTQLQTKKSTEHKAEGKPIKKVIPINMDFGSSACKANLGVEYFQKGPLVNVTSTISNDECGSSSGKYVVQVRVRNDNGDTQKIEFKETWERDGEDDVVQEKDYEIGDNVDVVRVRTRKLSCQCKAVAAAAPDETNDVAETP